MAGGSTSGDDQRCRFAPESDPGKRGEIAIGKRAKIHPGSMLLAHNGKISIGDDFSLNPYSVLYGTGGLAIGNAVRIAAHVVIIPANHVFTDPDRPIHSQGITKLGITIEDDVWIGAGAVILDGAHISRGCVIAAGAVVRGRTTPMAVFAGVPARFIKSRLPSIRRQSGDPPAHHAGLEFDHAEGSHLT